MALPRLPHHLSLLINTGRKRAGSRSEGSEPAGLAASLAGAGGAGAVPCCSVGPCWEETPSPHPPGMGIRSAHRARPCPGAETRVIALMSTAQGYPGATEVGRGRSKDFTRLSRGKGWPGGQVALPVTGAAGTGAQTWAAQRSWSWACSQLSGYLRRRVYSVPGPQPTLHPAVPCVGGPGEGQRSRRPDPVLPTLFHLGPCPALSPWGLDTWPHGAPIRLPKALTAGPGCLGECPGALGRTLRKEGSVKATNGPPGLSSEAKWSQAFLLPRPGLALPTSPHP